MRNIIVESKIFKLGSFMLFVGVFFSNLSNAQVPTEQPEERVILPEYVFVPPGFDDNDDAQVVIAGHLPNTCYRATSPTFEKREDGSVLIRNSTYYWTGCMCLEVLVPYFHVVDLKMLKKGNHRILTLDGLGREVEIGNLSVAQAAKKEPDDRLYAPVEEVTMEKDPEGVQRMKLRGEFPLSCMSLEGDPQVLRRVSNVIEVLPVAKKDPNAACVVGKYPFEVQITLGKLNFPTLVHIRTMNGQAINKVLNL